MVTGVERNLAKWIEVDHCTAAVPSSVQKMARTLNLMNLDGLDFGLERSQKVVLVG